MKQYGIHLVWLSALALTLLQTACVSGSASGEGAFENTACHDKVREALEFHSSVRRTREFFTDYVSERSMMGDDVMGHFYDVLGTNVSSVLLSMKEPYDEKISLRLNEDMDAFVQAVNRRVFSGGSLVEMQDVVSMRQRDEFLEVRINSPNIVSGVLYVICNDVEGRTVAEQTFVDYHMEDAEEPRKLSIDALKGLIE